MAVKLYDYQLEAIDKMNTGSILCGGVGSGKSRTSLAYYFIQEGGGVDSDLSEDNVYIPMSDPPRDLYIITTARKRDTFEWEKELNVFLMSTKKENNVYSNTIVVDSWNNIEKYKEIKDAFFIFDEQRVVGYGAWVKAFLQIAKFNDWILLSATPGDTWSDYIPVFIANGFYKNKAQFNREHVVFNRYSKFPQIDKYINTGRLIRLRNKILVDMDYQKKTVPHHEDIFVSFNVAEYKEQMKTRWNKEKEMPVENASELCYLLRRIVNTDISRLDACLKIANEKRRVIIFYNFDYELENLKEFFKDTDFDISEWNGHKHQPIPESNKWVYLVQYTAGAEGWNCIKTDTIIFYSQNYSYKIMAQSSGRIDRLNTPYKDLYFYHLKSRSGIDLAISKALSNKKKFNEMRFVNGK